VFCFAAAQAKKGLENAVKLGAKGFVFWGGREGYETLLNTDMKLEEEQKRRQDEEQLELDRLVETPSVIGGGAIQDDPDVPPVKQKTFVYRDYGEIINRLLARIESLTMTRQKLLKGLVVDLKSSDGSMAPKTGLAAFGSVEEFLKYAHEVDDMV